MNATSLEQLLQANERRQFLDKVRRRTGVPAHHPAPSILFRVSSEAQRANSRDVVGFLERGQPARSPPARGLGSAVSLPSGSVKETSTYSRGA